MEAYEILIQQAKENWKDWEGRDKRNVRKPVDTELPLGSWETVQSLAGCHQCTPKEHQGPQDHVGHVVDLDIWQQIVHRTRSGILYKKLFEKFEKFCYIVAAVCGVTMGDKQLPEDGKQDSVICMLTVQLQIACHLVIIIP